MTSSPKSGILIGATFTASPLEESISFWLRELDLPYRAGFTPYQQLFQTLLNPQEDFAANSSGANVALWRLEDMGSGDATLDRIETNVRELHGAIVTAAPRFRVPLLVCLCPESGSFLETGERQEFARRMRKEFNAGLAGKQNVVLICSNQVIADYEVTEVDDPLAQQAGHVPYRPEFYAALGTQIVRVVAGLNRKLPKVIAVDCDNTLWTGVCGEDGPDGVIVDAGRISLQEFLQAQKRLGRLLAISSKNNEQDVRDTFRAHPEMPLRFQDFSAHRINWESKSGNLLELAADLNLGADSFVLLDDDGKECAEVRQNVPGTVTIQIPHHTEQLKAFLKRLWVFDHFQPVTEEDLRRSRLYADDSQRRTLERQAVDLRSFLAALRLQVVFAPVTSGTLSRVAQLSQRTNQMNTTLERLTGNDLSRQIQEGLQAFTVSVSDRFGDYGLVGAVFARWEPEALAVTALLLSCRALGRGVEHKMLAHAAELALNGGRNAVRIAVRVGPRNQPVLQFVESVMGVKVARDPEHLQWFSLPARDLKHLEMQLPAGESGHHPSADAPAVAIGNRSSPAVPIDYPAMALTLGTASQLTAKLRENRSAAAISGRVVGALPETRVQQELAAIWADLLGLHPIGIEEDFFDLGGHSLLAVQLISRIHQDLGVTLPDSAIYAERLKISSLARTIELMKMGVEDLEGYETALAEIESLSDEEVAALLAEQESSNER